MKVIYEKEKSKYIPMDSAVIKRVSADKPKEVGKSVLSGPEWLIRTAYLKSLLSRVRSKRPRNAFVKSLHTIYWKKPRNMSRRQIAILEEIDAQVKREAVF